MENDLKAGDRVKIVYKDSSLCSRTGIIIKADGAEGTIESNKKLLYKVYYLQYNE